MDSAFRTSSIHVPKSMFIVIFRCYADIADGASFNCRASNEQTQTVRSGVTRVYNNYCPLRSSRNTRHGKKSRHEYDFSVVPTM